MKSLNYIKISMLILSFAFGTFGLMPFSNLLSQPLSNSSDLSFSLEKIPADKVGKVVVVRDTTEKSGCQRANDEGIKVKCPEGAILETFFVTQDEAIKNGEAYVKYAGDSYKATLEVNELFNQVRSKIKESKNSFTKFSVPPVTDQVCSGTGNRWDYFYPSFDQSPTIYVEVGYTHTSCTNVRLDYVTADSSKPSVYYDKLLYSSYSDDPYCPVPSGTNGLPTGQTWYRNPYISGAVNYTIVVGFENGCNFWDARAQDDIGDTSL